MNPGDYMKRLCLVTLILLFTSELSHAGEYKVRKSAGRYVIEMRINRNPPVVDKNILTLNIRDGNGKYVTDARVMVNYYMPPMPGMPPMNYKTYAQLSGREYKATMDLIMSGPWNIVIKITRTGKTSTVRFAIDVR
jgi:hypothetical protein